MRTQLLLLALTAVAVSSPIDNANTTGCTPTAAPPTPIEGPGCGPCNYSMIWNDVIYLIDSSEAAGAKSLSDMFGLIQSTSSWYNVQKSTYTNTDYHMRVGVISYASKAQVLAPLGSINMDDLYNMDPKYHEGDEGTNIEEALELAVAQFNSSHHRANAKKVVVLMATTYNSGNYHAPKKAATAFVEDGGVLIVYDYVPNHGLPSETLKEIASSGYFIYSPDSSMNSLMNAQCDANCFCPHNFKSLSNSPRQTPTEGCYYAVDIQNNFHVASNNCKNKYNKGYIAKDQSDRKNQFLTDGYNSAEKFFIGLSFDSNSKQWKWSDGTTLSGNYQPWTGGHTPSSGADGSCVYVSNGTNGTNWVQTDCRNGFDYTCESRPCASTNYCVKTDL